MVARRPAYMYTLAGKIIDICHRWRCGAGDDDFVDPGQVVRGEEVDQLVTLRGDCQVAGRDVGQPVTHPRQQLVARLSVIIVEPAQFLVSEQISDDEAAVDLDKVQIPDAQVHEKRDDGEALKELMRPAEAAASAPM